MDHKWIELILEIGRQMGASDGDLAAVIAGRIKKDASARVRPGSTEPAKVPAERAAYSYAASDMMARFAHRVISSPQLPLDAPARNIVEEKGKPDRRLRGEILGMSRESILQAVHDLRLQPGSEICAYEIVHRVLGYVPKTSGDKRCCTRFLMKVPGFEYVTAPRGRSRNMTEFGTSPVVRITERIVPELAKFNQPEDRTNEIPSAS
jgi:hypothetical protein